MMKLLLKFLWFRVQQYWLKQWKARYLRAVCWFNEHEWVNDGSWAAKARKCKLCGLREKGKTV